MRDVIYAYHLPPCVPSPSFKSRRILAARANRIGNLQRQFTLRINRVFFQLSSGVISVYLRMGPFFSFSILLAHHVTHAYTSKHTLAKSSNGNFIWRIIYEISKTWCSHGTFQTPFGLIPLWPATLKTYFIIALHNWSIIEEKSITLKYDFILAHHLGMRSHLMKIRCIWRWSEEYAPSTSTCPDKFPTRTFWVSLENLKVTVNHVPIGIFTLLKDVF